MTQTPKEPIGKPLVPLNPTGLVLVLEDTATRTPKESLGRPVVTLNPTGRVLTLDDIDAIASGRALLQIARYPPRDMKLNKTERVKFEDAKRLGYYVENSGRVETLAHCWLESSNLPVVRLRVRGRGARVIMDTIAVRPEVSERWTRDARAAECVLELAKDFGGRVENCGSFTWIRVPSASGPECARRLRALYDTFVGVGNKPDVFVLPFVSALIILGAGLSACASAPTLSAQLGALARPVAAIPQGKVVEGAAVRIVAWPEPPAYLQDVCDLPYLPEAPSVPEMQGFLDPTATIDAARYYVTARQIQDVLEWHREYASYEKDLRLWAEGVRKCVRNLAAPVGR